jgi:hypothetical protein
VEDPADTLGEGVVPFFGVLWIGSLAVLITSVVASVGRSDWLASSILLWIAYGMLMIVTVALFIDRYWKLVPRD